MLLDRAVTDHYGNPRPGDAPPDLGWQTAHLAKRSPLLDAVVGPQ